MEFSDTTAITVAFEVERTGKSNAVYLNTSVGYKYVGQFTFEELIADYYTDMVPDTNVPVPPDYIENTQTVISNIKQQLLDALDSVSRREQQLEHLARVADMYSQYRYKDLG